MFDRYDSDLSMDAAPVGEQSPQGHYIPDKDECMRCGQCVSVCPTFKLCQIDAQTPRARLRSISKILVHKQTLSTDEQAALSACLQCRACETRCPSQVAYGALFDEMQAKLSANRTHSFWTKRALHLIEHKTQLRRLLPLVTLYQRLGLSKLLRATGLLKRLGLVEAERLTTQPALSALAACYSPTAEPRGRVALFTGCLAEHFDRDAQLAAIAVLNALGYAVLVPPEQGCCGAIHQHMGLSANELITHNQRLFAELEVDAVLFSASGCGAMLQAYPSGAVFQDVQSFIVAHWPKHLVLKKTSLKVLVHEPCSQRNVLKNTADTYALLAKIPGLSVAPLADNGICCGAGGSYMLTHPDNAQALRALKRQAISQTEADAIVSSNFGCRLFINAESPTPKMIHPLQLVNACILA